MKEAIGNMLEVDCDAIVVTTNGFVKTNGECVMGKGIAKQIAELFPEFPKLLGTRITKMGNRVHWFTQPNIDEVIVTFPVKNATEVYDGTNVVNHMKSKFTIGDIVAGWACKAQLELIEQSAHQLVHMTDEFGWSNVICPRFGCGAGELDWETEVKPLVEPILDDRFTVYTFK